MSRRSILIEALESAPRDLTRLLRPIDAMAAQWRPAPDEWCIADVGAHLSYCEAPYLARLRRVVEQDNPLEPSLLPDESAHDLAQSLADLLEAFVARRAELVAFLSSLDQRDWGRPLVHATIGPTKLRDQVQELVAHDNLHLEQIVTLRERLAAASRE